jgi:cyclase
VDKQRSVLLGWKTAVADAVAAGWTKEEAQTRVQFPDVGPVDIGQEYMLEYVETLNAGSLFGKLSAHQAPPVTPRS